MIQFVRWAITGGLAAMLAASGGVARGNDGTQIPRAKDETQTLVATAQADNAQALYLLGAAELQRSDRPDPVKAARWLTKAAERGHDGAKVMLAGLYVQGAPGVIADPVRAVQLLQSPARAGNAEAQALLGELTRDGRGTVRDERMAARWLGLAAEAGQAGAALDLGQLYVDGRGIEADPVRAAQWLVIASSRGSDAIKRQAEARLATLTDSAPQGRLRAEAWLAAHRP